MDFIVVAFLSANSALILAVLFGISEALAAIPQLKANNVFQLIFSALKALAGSDAPKPQV